MDTRIQLLHPEEKTGVTMEQGRYEALRKIMLEHLRNNEGSTQAELVKVIIEEFSRNNVKFDGSIEWHTEWVKLDLEARNEIQRKADRSPITYSLRMEEGSSF